ncbi:unnamed protein product [Cylindrotheca closterium]|uniref:Calcineurin-like phosphoesterase domain-containing protein n=1 Tax=Cylindrotheca closterium TaxID=2856 RepID=A0AAD2CAP8_9STRA|nr:unnamed protein product [Cylindrotheca closterium]
MSTTIAVLIVLFLKLSLAKALVSSYWRYGQSQPRVASTPLKMTGNNKMDHLTKIDRVLCISDLHVDHNDNMEWLANHTLADTIEGISLQESDLVVVAGDISHDLERIEQALGYLQRQGSSILFVPGNHEAWLHSSELDKGDSYEKLERINDLCQSMCVHTNPVLVGNTEERPHGLWIAPLQSWYDGTLSVASLEDLCDDFGRWPWVDFIKCRWRNFAPMGGGNKRIPNGLVEYFLEQNRVVWDGMEDAMKSSPGASCSNLMTVSHFLPNQQCLPDWVDVDSSEFDRNKWLEHGGGGVSAKFAKVAGTKLLDEQIRNHNLAPIQRQLHIFGHSHRPKDFEKDQIRYIHNPLGKPRERDIFMVSPKVDFQPVWDTRSGEIRGETIIRFWDEKGGGVDALRERMKKSKRKTRYGKGYKKVKKKSKNQTTERSSR